MSNVNCLKIACKGVKGLHVHLEDSKEYEENVETNSSNEDPFTPPHQLPQRS